MADAGATTSTLLPGQDPVVTEAALRYSQEIQALVPTLPDEMGLFRQEVEKMLNALTKSQESEQRLVRRTREIVHEIGTNQDKYARDKEEELEAYNYKKKVQVEIEVMWGQVANSHKIETEKQAKLNDLRTSIAMLEEELKNGSGWSEAQEEAMAKLKRQRADGAREVDTKTTELQQVRMQVNALHALVTEAEEEQFRLDEALARANEDVAERKSSADKETRRKFVLEKQLKALKSEAELLNAEHKRKVGQVKDGEAVLKQKETQLRESKARMEKYLKQYDVLYRSTHQFTEAMESQWQKNQEILAMNNHMETEVATKEDVIAKLVTECTKIEALVELTKEKIADVNAAKAKVDAKRDTCKLALNELENVTMEVERKQGEAVRKTLDDLIRQRELVNKMLVRAADTSQGTHDLIKIQENTMKNLENEISGYRQSVKKQRDMIQQLVADRDRYDKEAEAANKKYRTALEEAKLQDLQVVSLQDKINEGEARLKQQQNLYEAVRSDRNLYSKSLIESQEEIADMKRKFKIMNHQIEQLKEEITTKDHSLVKEHFDHHKVDKDKETLKAELTRIKKQIQSSEQIITNQEQEISKLASIIQEADDERQRQLKEYNAVINDRDNLRAQLILRNEELKSLYEKIKIQKSTLNIGQAQYAERVKEVRALETRVLDLMAEHKKTEDQISCTGDLKSELLRLERDLLQERTKIKALSEELDHPMNVHRWRKLEGSDPKRFDMCCRKLIKKSEEACMKDLLIVEKEKLYVELKNVLARQPGPEVAEQLLVYQDNLKKKQAQMKNMENELDMYKAQVREYKHDLQRIDKEMLKLKETWLHKVRAEANELPVDPEMDDVEPPEQSSNQGAERPAPPAVPSPLDESMFALGK
ncbi:hypothetical protein SPRG_12321 [Saprolegnia parasitica CBS 223.65]|uniref:Cilia- and flagella-associated protein 58 central coiled coil domain-containing protein n=1 Tax=Saprolegnia parasitica (strain CBS 223.65) TaxID=695850 RepID=A0A067BZH3_SAPPC|nr:hypothetical protein SPRG_12321 [Saprolegnia parasitica CBS 223.65]KDO22235.1 hypothetical protein SPRG_12321 [Saprolegnia parasitica CBS 223.65]|eukprot:XP_012207072.1 hypothetical protein SPRG_12321 [Saprolegnia parasitica CBS 223.65]